MACEAPDRPDGGIRYRSLSNFYLADPRRIASQERDLGMWRVGLHGPSYRAAWVRETGELYAAQLGMPKEQGEVHVLGRGSDEELEKALEGWADICPQPDSMTWLRHRATGLAQPEKRRGLSRRQRDLALADPRAQAATDTLTDSARQVRAAGVGDVRVGKPRLTLVAAGVERESREWIARLRATGPEHDAALAELHALLLRTARFEIGRRADSGRLRGGDYDDVAQQSADDALVAILRKLGDFRGESRFTTWTCKFALYEAAAKVRKRSWQGREIPLSPEAWPLIADDHQSTAQQSVEMTDQLSALHEAIEEELTPHQREVLVALALNEVPIEVLVERLSMTRGALYKTLHDGRQKLRGALTARGVGLDELEERSVARARIAWQLSPQLTGLP